MTTAARCSGCRTCPGAWRTCTGPSPSAWRWCTETSSWRTCSWTPRGAPRCATSASRPLWAPGRRRRRRQGAAPSRGGRATRARGTGRCSRGTRAASGTWRRRTSCARSTGTRWTSSPLASSPSRCWRARGLTTNSSSRGSRWPPPWPYGACALRCPTAGRALSPSSSPPAGTRTLRGAPSSRRWPWTSQGSLGVPTTWRSSRP
mmetsp:Transcript_21824/g.73448  ORF Transcript_21824/g.73448 Transcript_21824/m.73448 type:complete len:204 (+) Transcript_21824:554-1165(+)